MIVGFTGTRWGMTVRQKDSLAFWLRVLMAGWAGDHSSFHHGGCSGADEEADTIASALVAPEDVHVYPADKSVATHSQLVMDRAEQRTVHPAKPPLVRNEDIVNICEVLVATPRERAEVQRSGTWHAVRYARKVGKPTLMLWP